MSRHDPYRLTIEKLYRALGEEIAQGHGQFAIVLKDTKGVEYYPDDDEGCTFFMDQVYLFAVGDEKFDWR